MTEADKALKAALVRLHEVEHDLELANAITPSDHRLNDAEIEIHSCIGAVERIYLHPRAGEKWDCSKHGHVDTGGMFAFSCKHCDYDEHL